MSRWTPTTSLWKPHYELMEALLKATTADLLIGGRRLYLLNHSFARKCPFIISCPQTPEYLWDLGLSMTRLSFFPWRIHSWPSLTKGKEQNEQRNCDTVKEGNLIISEEAQRGTIFRCNKTVSPPTRWHMPLVTIGYQSPKTRWQGS